MSDNALLKHPAEFFIRYLLLKDRQTTDATLEKTLDDWGFLQPAPTFWGFARQRAIAAMPAGFNPANRLDRASMKFLRDQQVYDLFFPTAAVELAWTILTDPTQRIIIEQALMARLDHKTAASQLNRKNNWFLTGDALAAFNHFFWNVKLLTFDEWGRFLYNRTSMYDRHMALLQGSPALAFFHLRIEQSMESKKMIQRSQEIAYHTLEEVNLRPGTGPDKIKAIGLLGKVVVDAHNALSTSDMALKDVLRNFERFRMEHPKIVTPDIRQLAPGGNYTGSGNEGDGGASPAIEPTKVH